ncbi:MAG: carboxypeptidase regulatory-like domain-containing protein [Acidobacteria bacterium]|nr:carboxypeptidase regulatory-like domain-containing protein [Acidobacteriota bacterium]
MLLLLLFLLADSMFAAELTGGVYGPSGAVISGATVIPNTRPADRSFIARSMGDGSFRFDTLAAGTYDLEVRVPGFALYQRRGRNIAEGRRTVMETLHISAAGQPRTARPPRRAPSAWAAT